jgi:hypothetical protein
MAVPITDASSVGFKYVHIFGDWLRPVIMSTSLV